MANTGWNDGPYNLTNQGITAAVTHISPGAYALGRYDGKAFYVDYVGRSDNDLRARLLNHVGKYTHFKAGYLPSALDAFIKECSLYHDFNPRDNKIHPDRPQNSKWECPICDIYD